MLINGNTIRDSVARGDIAEMSRRYCGDIAEISKSYLRAYFSDRQCVNLGAEIAETGIAVV